MSLGFSVDDLRPKARGGGVLKMGLVRLDEVDWLQPDPDLSARAEGFAEFADGVQTSPDGEAPGAELAAMLGLTGGLPEAAQGAGMSAFVEPGDAGALTAAMQGAVDEAGRWRFAAVGAPAWTEASIVEAHRAVYRQVLSRRSSMISAERDQA